jgi:hypothetical protein
MRHDPLFILWSITCPSPQDCRRLQQWLPAEVTRDSTVVDEVRASPEGIETVRREVHRIGDYFESVDVFPSAGQEPMSFRLLFRRRPTAGRFWKDMMVRILQRVRVEAGDATTTLEYRGDEEPIVVAARG